MTDILNSDIDAQETSEWLDALATILEDTWKHRESSIVVRPSTDYDARFSYKRRLIRWLGSSSLLFHVAMNVQRTTPPTYKVTLNTKSDANAI